MMMMTMRLGMMMMMMRMVMSCAGPALLGVGGAGLCEELGCAKSWSPPSG